jgi:hypothetical protein
MKGVVVVAVAFGLLDLFLRFLHPIERALIVGLVTGYIVGKAHESEKHDVGVHLREVRRRFRFRRPHQEQEE